MAQRWPPCAWSTTTIITAPYAGPGCAVAAGRWILAAVPACLHQVPCRQQSKVDSSPTRPRGRLRKGVAMTHHEHPNVTLVQEGFAALERGDTAWMHEHLADDVVWHVGGNSKWAGAYQGKAKVLEYFGRQGQATETAVEIHDILGNDEHVVVLGSAKATAQDGSSAEWKYTQVFHVRDGKATEVWGMAENDAAVDPFLDRLPG